VLSRTGGSASGLRDGIVDEGWTDTVLVLPGEAVRVQVTFSRYPGLYLYHCHILEHEDMGMMRNFRIRA
jgi:FtsP/CotA-like multicopper oxidase with cupredoxin domain